MLHSVYVPVENNSFGIRDVVLWSVTIDIALAMTAATKG